MTNCMVEQLGLAMILCDGFKILALISGTISGISGNIRQ